MGVKKLLKAGIQSEMEFFDKAAKKDVKTENSINDTKDKKDNIDKNSKKDTKDNTEKKDKDDTNNKKNASDNKDNKDTNDKKNKDDKKEEKDTKSIEDKYDIKDNKDTQNKNDVKDKKDTKDNKKEKSVEASKEKIGVCFNMTEDNKKFLYLESRKIGIPIEAYFEKIAMTHKTIFQPDKAMDIAEVHRSKKKIRTSLKVREDLAAALKERARDSYMTNSVYYNAIIDEEKKKAWK